MSSLKPEIVLPCGRHIPRKIVEKEKERKITIRRKLDAYLQTHQLKQSTVRNLILDVILDGLWHFTASELIQTVGRKHSEVGDATIYRNLQVFLQSGILREPLVSQGGERVFEIESEGHHDHIVCLDCNTILEFREEVIEEAQEKLSRRLKFDLQGHRHVIYAKCKYKK